jgi:hypothetical protein
MSHQFLTSSGIYLSGGGASSSSTTWSGNLALQGTLINIQQFDQISIDELNEDVTRLSVDDKKRTLALITGSFTSSFERQLRRLGIPLHSKAGLQSKLEALQLDISSLDRTGLWKRC